MDLSSDVGTTRVRRTGLYLANEKIDLLSQEVHRLQEQLEEQRARTEQRALQLANQQQEHEQYIAERAEAHMAELAEEKKQHGYTKSNKDSYYRQLEDANKELNGMHDVLNMLPNVPARKYKDDNNYDQDRGLAVRFSTMLGINSYQQSMK